MIRLQILVDAPRNDIAQTILALLLHVGLELVHALAILDLTPYCQQGRRVRCGE